MVLFHTLLDMIIPTIPANEQERLQELYSLGILDSDNEPLFDDLVKISAHLLDCPISLISLVDADRQWFKAREGLEVAQTGRNESFCAHALDQEEALIVEDALCDERFFDNPLVTGEPNIRFYAGHPLITKGGFRLGTLCVIDRRAKKLSVQQHDMLQRLARQASSLLERRKSELELRRIRRNSQGLFRQMPGVIFSLQGEQHIAEYISSDHVAFFDNKNDLGKPLSVTHPEARDNGLIELLDSVYHHGQTHALRDSTFLIGQEERHYDYLLTPRFGLDGSIDGVMGVVEDITDRRRLELAVAKLTDERIGEHRRLAELFEQVPVAVALFEGPDDRVAFANRLYRQYFFARHADADQSFVAQALPAHHQALAPIIAGVKQRGTAASATEASLLRCSADGGEEAFFATYTCQPKASSAGSDQGVLVAILDVSEQVGLRAEISAQLDALRDEREIRERFVATLTHDLRTPLTSAKMFAEVLLYKADKPREVKTTAKRVIGSIDRSELMVRDLLDANRLQAGEGLPISPRTTTVGETLQEAAETFRLTRKCTLNVVNRAEATEVLWDDNAIRRVIDNLVSNAVKYGSRNAAITLAAQASDDYVELSVHNNGPAIPEAEQGRLFESYHRAASAIGSGQKGWGIGLALVKGIAEAHGGSVRVDSQPQAGTTFFVRLPKQASTEAS